MHAINVQQATKQFRQTKPMETVMLGRRGRQSHIAAGLHVQVEQDMAKQAWLPL